MLSRVAPASCRTRTPPRRRPSKCGLKSQPRRAGRRFPGIKLTKEELRNIRLALGPTLSLAQAAAHAQLSPATLKRKVCEGSFRDCVKREKPLVFLTERFFQELFRGVSQ